MIPVHTLSKAMESCQMASLLKNSFRIFDLNFVQFKVQDQERVIKLRGAARRAVLYELHTTLYQQR